MCPISVFRSALAPLNRPAAGVAGFSFAPVWGQRCLFFFCLCVK